ncbi:hypothetical protein RQP46_007063 [Phenoliferia psychrophenolica]
MNDALEGHAPGGPARLPTKPTLIGACLSIPIYLAISGLSLYGYARVGGYKSTATFFSEATTLLAMLGVAGLISALLSAWLIWVVRKCQAASLKGTNNVLIALYGVEIAVFWILWAVTFGRGTEGIQSACGTLAGTDEQTSCSTLSTILRWLTPTVEAVMIVFYLWTFTASRHLHKILATRQGAHQQVAVHSDSASDYEDTKAFSSFVLKKSPHVVTVAQRRRAAPARPLYLEIEIEGQSSQLFLFLHRGGT